MDSNLDKRLEFRESIRKKAIQQIKKSKRKLYEEHRQQIQQQILYQQILNNSSQVFEEAQKYLQILRQALNSSGVRHYKNMLSQVLLNLVNFYERSEHVQQTNLLIIECIATIYYQTTSPFNQLNKRALQILLRQLSKNKVGGHNKTLIKNRCLVGILNITSTQNKSILGLCQEAKLLQDLQNMLEDFPVDDSDKINILGIYGNIINFHLEQSHHTQKQAYYPLLLKSCFQQTINSEIIQKVVQVIINLLRQRKCHVFDVMQNLSAIYYQLLQNQYYTEDSQWLLAQSLQCFATCQQISYDYSLLNKLEELLEYLCTKFSQKVNNNAIGKSYYLLTVIYNKYYQQSIEIKLNDVIRQISDFWIQLQDDCSFQFQIYFLKCIQSCLCNLPILKKLIMQYQSGLGGQNSIKAPTWEVIQQFIRQVRLQQPQKMLDFLSILSLKHFTCEIKQEFRQNILQKVQGCYYNCLQNKEISQLAQKILFQFKQESNNH